MGIVDNAFSRASVLSASGELWLVFAIVTSCPTCVLIGWKWLTSAWCHDYAKDKRPCSTDGRIGHGSLGVDVSRCGWKWAGQLPGGGKKNKTGKQDPQERHLPKDGRTLFLYNDDDAQVKIKKGDNKDWHEELPKNGEPCTILESNPPLYEYKEITNPAGGEPVQQTLDVPLLECLDNCLYPWLNKAACPHCRTVMILSEEEQDAICHVNVPACLKQ